MTTLQDKGYRYMYIGDGVFDWIHETDTNHDFIDCTDMNDDEFESFVFAIGQQEITAVYYSED